MSGHDRPILPAPRTLPNLNSQTPWDVPPYRDYTMGVLQSQLRTVRNKGEHPNLLPPPPP